ncbi:MAG: sigma-70 family RNA polymerase sigma factor [Acidimicrobiia bacterium]|nr:sigma-70 family RNA polymerase sigma factor [Acidimicrobiia bacterium]
MEGDGREAQFAEVYAAHFRPLVTFCRRQLGPNGDAEALAQEAFLRAWASWDRYAPARPFWPWVSTIARRLCIDQARRRRRAAAHPTPPVDDIPPLEPDEAVIALDEYAWARAALAGLRPHQQRVLHLREVDGWSYDRIASHEGVSVESVRGALKRSRQALRAAYTRLSEWNPVVLVVVALRSLTRRISHRAQRTHMVVAVSGMGDRAANAIAVAVVVGLGATGGGGFSARPPLPVAAATAPSSTGERAAAPAPLTSAPTAGGDLEHGQRAGAQGAVPPARQTSPPTPPDGGLRLPGQGGDTPEGSEFVSFTPSPNYANDHEVYASGVATRQCLLGSCPTLFHSTDGGMTWVRLWSLDFGGGTVLLPPSYPADHRVFEIDAHALRVAADGGHLFRPLTPLGGHAVMSPGFSSVDRQILVGAMPGWIYHDPTSLVTPFNLAPEPTSVALSFAYSPAYTSDHKLVVGGTGLLPWSQSMVSRCAGTICTTATPLAGSAGTPSLLASRTYATSGLTYAWQLARFYRSVDGGASFTPVALPAAGTVQSVAEDDAGRLYVALLSTGSGGTSSGGVFSSPDAGRTWTRIGAGTALDRGATAVMPLPDGRLLVAPYASNGGGLLCSDDGGGTFAPRCSVNGSGGLTVPRMQAALSSGR